MAGDIAHIAGRSEGLTARSRTRRSALCARRRRGKYDRAGLYLITQHGVFAPQLRDLFSAGSVGARGGKRGHKYIVDALRNIEPEMIDAAAYLDDRLFEEHWGFPCPSRRRITEWLRQADMYATDWTPSEELFRG